MENLENEIWKDVVGYEGIYSVSNKGRLKNIQGTKTVFYTKGVRKGTMCTFNIRPFIIYGTITKNGYHRYNLRKNLKNKNHFLHRLVGIAFIPNPENKKEINHIDGIKINNYVENLEWCTPLENMRHAVNFGLKTVKDSTLKALHKGSLEKWDIKDFRQKNVRRVINIETGVIHASVAHAARFHNIPKDSLRNFLKRMDNGYIKIYKNHKNYPLRFES